MSAQAFAQKLAFAITPGPGAGAIGATPAQAIRRPARKAPAAGIGRPGAAPRAATPAVSQPSAPGIGGGVKRACNNTKGKVCGAKGGKPPAKKPSMVKLPDGSGFFTGTVKSGVAMGAPASGLDVRRAMAATAAAQNRTGRAAVYEGNKLTRGMNQMVRRTAQPPVSGRMGSYKDTFQDNMNAMLPRPSPTGPQIPQADATQMVPSMLSGNRQVGLNVTNPRNLAALRQTAMTQGPQVAFNKQFSSDAVPSAVWASMFADALADCVLTRAAAKPAGEKTALLAGPTLGALIGAMKARKGRRMAGVGHGAGIGAATEIGAGAGGGLGMLAGLLGGPLAPVTVPLGGIAGAGLGGYTGYRAGQALSEDIGGSKGQPWGKPPAADGKKKPEKQEPKGAGGK